MAPNTNTGPLRIAILEADTPLDKTRKQYGSYGGVFEALFKAGAKRIGFPDEKDLVMTCFDIRNDPGRYPDLEEIDAILITGSRYDSFGSDPWIVKLVEFTRRVLAEGRVRIIGVCFGHQIVGRALGVQVGRNEGGGWEASVCEVNLYPKGKELFGKDKLRIHQMHRDIVHTYPETVEPLGWSPRCEVQGMYSARRLITVQGHPEFNEEIVRELLETRHSQGIFDGALFQDTMQRVGNEQDGVHIAGVFIKFLLDGR